MASVRRSARRRDRHALAALGLVLGLAVGGCDRGRDGGPAALGGCGHVPIGVLGDGLQLDDASPFPITEDPLAWSCTWLGPQGRFTVVHRRYATPSEASAWLARERAREDFTIVSDGERRFAARTDRGFSTAVAVAQRFAVSVDAVGADPPPADLADVAGAAANALPRPR